MPNRFASRRKLKLALLSNYVRGCTCFAIGGKSTGGLRHADGSRVLGGVELAPSRLVWPKKLKEVIDKVITDSGASTTDLFNDGSSRGCKVFVCATCTETTGIKRIRSYSLPGGLDVKVTICDAALATSAATGFFDPVTIGARQFVDGALGANNPIGEVEAEASKIWCSDRSELKPLVKCFVSIGTGNPGKKADEGNIHDADARDLPSDEPILRRFESGESNQH
ncbi:uncharacterized protein K441DRAFT_682333 [Cenococcum geophilum 1.58]|uniref:Uncharacterized protein n=1 Tax=Cenococcum geophilum 1.58 TaxID=794803 RepID=A0ACC8ENB5_9PEZI|nr:hypothetical protein K441DRAFT_682333 [Cenococcum geophilum 1.58]